MSASILRPFDMGDPGAPKGSESWCRWLHFEILRLVGDKEQIGDRLQMLVSAFEDTTAFSKLTDRNGRPFIDFADYCQAPPPYGLGRTPDVIHEEAQIRACSPNGTNRYTSARVLDSRVDTINPSQGGGTSARYTAARLKRDRPDLASRVEAGDLSANAAAIEAGFRPKTVTVPLTVDGATRLMLRLSEDERDTVIARLVGAAS